MAWEYPTYKAEEKVTDGSAARQVRRALSQAVAFSTLAGNDPRPLLVLRECKVCNGTDDALLSKGADNERTFLLSSWFHCIKLPVDVLQKDHPFYEAFGHDNPEHLFVALPDGSLKIKLEGQTSRTELWEAMSKMLAAAYKSEPQSVVKVVQKTLDRMDLLDQKLVELRAKKNELLETEPATSKKIVKINNEIEDMKNELAGLLTEVAKASKLDLKDGTTVSSAGAGAAKDAR